MHLLVRLLVTAPSLVVAILAPFDGALADRFGRRRQLWAGSRLAGSDFPMWQSRHSFRTSIVAI
ncbi:hypothetical protein [Mesorhizobium sp. M0019]|uniref:hypothetical protein n=1 Tax=Mesorhizobium sp. M0019 TaxID=2956845 RepID=UPI00333A13CD